MRELDFTTLPKLGDTVELLVKEEVGDNVETLTYKRVNGKLIAYFINPNGWASVQIEDETGKKIDGELAKMNCSEQFEIDLIDVDAQVEELVRTVRENHEQAITELNTKADELYAQAFGE